MKENIIHKAARYASLKHGGQLDANGENYFLKHLQVVALVIQQMTKNENVIAAAYLHDVIEDTPVTESELRKEFGSRVTDLVMEVTHEGTKDSYGYYFPRLHSKEGIMIKLADRLSNISRMQAWDNKRQEQYLRKTKFWKDGSDL
jgi:(p)ppGpp synthase/HD superfamily hydrolase